MIYHALSNTSFECVMKRKVFIVVVALMLHFLNSCMLNFVFVESRWYKFGGRTMA